MTTVALSTPGQLLEDAAAAFERARLHLAWAGIDSGTTEPAHALRTFEDQVRLFLSRYTPQLSGSGPYGDVRTWNGTRYVRTSPLGPAARPGTSNHGTGRTVDWQNLDRFDTPRWARAAQILTAHGWDNTEGRTIGEPWHWTYNPANDRKGGTEMADIQAQINDIHARVMGGLPGQAARQEARILDDKDGGYIVAKLTALQAAVEVLAKGQGIDPATLTKTIDTAVANALAGLTVTIGKQG